MDTRLFINTNGNYAEVDLYDDIDIPVTYNVGDVRDITKKDSNWSLTIRMPNTQNNAQLFELTNDISRYNSTFEMLKQYPAYVEVGCNRTFEGYFKLTKVIINDNEDVSYEGNLYSNVIEFMSRLGTTTLRGNTDPSDDLSFTDYATTLTATEWFHRTDTMTWDTTPDPDEPTGYKTWGKDFYFAIIDKYNFGQRNFTTNQHNEEGIPIFFDEFTPYLYYKEIWDRIFEWAGFSYVSDFIQNTANNTTTFEFDHLAYPASNYFVGSINDYYSIVNQSRLPSVTSSMDYEWHRQEDPNTHQVTNPTLVLNQNVFYNNYYQPLTLSENPVGSTRFGIYSTQCWKYTAPTSGHYSINCDIKWKFDVLTTDIMGNSWQSYLGGQMYCNTNAFWRVAVSLIYHNTSNNTDTTIAISDSGNQTYESMYNFSNGIINMLSDQLLQHSGEIYLQTGDYLRIDGWVFLTETTGNSNYVMQFADDTGRGQWGRISFLPIELNSDVLNVSLLDEFYIGTYFDPTVILNPKRKKVDFIADIIKKFNLYIEDVTDKKDANGHYYRDTNYYPVGDNMRIGEPILRIEPRPLYYNNEQVVRDWTSKTDVGTIEFSRINDYLYNILYFNDKDDKTYLIEDYNNYNYTEGEFGEEIITSPFNTSDNNKTEVNTELGQTMIYCPKIDYNKYLECPLIITFNNDGTIKKDKEYNDRMLFACNVYPGNDPNNVYPWDFSGIWNNSRAKCWNVYYRNNTSPDNPTLYYGYARTYIMLNHFNVPFGKDTADLNFGWANWYHQNLNGTWATAENTYKVFYQQMVDDYNSPEARMMKCKMYLKSSDIRDLKLSDIILVNNVAYHINKIKQWKSEYEPVEVELIKIIQSTSKNNQPILKSKRPPKMEIVTLNTLKELIESQNKAINQISKQVEKLDGTIKKMDEQLIKLDERVKKLEGGTETSEDGSDPDKDENNKDDYD